MLNRRKEIFIGLILIAIATIMLVTILANAIQFVIIRKISDIFGLLKLLILVATAIILSICPLKVGLKLATQCQVRPLSLSELEKRVKRTKYQIFILPVFVYLFGIDGAGKTTHIALLMKYCRESKMKFRYVWLRWAAFFSYPLLALCKLLGYTKSIHTATGKIIIHSFYRNKAIARLWTWIFSLDFVLHTFIRITAPMKLGFSILCDRFVIDAMVDLIIESRINIFRILPGRILIRLLPENSILIMLDVEEVEALRRKRDIPCISYVIARRRLYKMFSRILDAYVVDTTNKSIYEVHRVIINKVLKSHPFGYVLDTKVNT